MGFHYFQSIVAGRTRSQFQLPQGRIPPQPRTAELPLHLHCLFVKARTGVSLHERRLSTFEYFLQTPSREDFGNRGMSATVGWTDCGHSTTARGVVLDPFVGTGTTLLTAVKMGFDAVGVDLTPLMPEQIEALDDEPGTLPGTLP